jgi:hypothetical protein
LSFGSAPTAFEENGAPGVVQTTTLFVGREAAIPPGSKITVTQNGVTETYAASGTPKVYTVHLEITLELYERWAAAHE